MAIAWRCAPRAGPNREHLFVDVMLSAPSSKQPVPRRSGADLTRRARALIGTGPLCRAPACIVEEAFGVWGGGRVAGMREHQFDQTERLAVLSLWAVPGIGPKTLEALKQLFGGDFAGALRAPVRQWAGAVELSDPSREFLAGVDRIEDLGQRHLEGATRRGIGIAYPGDVAFPANLVGL